MTPALPPIDTDSAGLSLTRIDPSHNMARFYRLAVQPGLFGEWGVVREWGRIGSSGRMRTDWYPSEDLAMTAQAALARRKARRGYSRVV